MLSIFIIMDFPGRFYNEILNFPGLGEFLLQPDLCPGWQPDVSPCRQPDSIASASPRMVLPPKSGGKQMSAGHLLLIGSSPGGTKKGHPEGQCH